MNNTISTLELEPSPYKGSIATAEIVKRCVLERYGQEALDSWTPNLTRSFKNWLSQGYRVRSGEKAIQSFTILNSKSKDGKERVYKKNVYLFHVNQVEPIN